MAIVVWVLTTCSPFTNAATANKTNVLFFVIDDLNMGVGAFGDDLASTPRIDELVNSGAKYTNAHVIKSECAPSRTTMFTGRLPDMNRVWDFESNLRTYNPTMMTLPGLFRQAGYRTVALGKVYDPRAFKSKEKLDLCTDTNPTYCSWDKYVSLEIMEKDGSACNISKVKYSWQKKQKKKNRGKAYMLIPNNKEKYTVDYCSATAAQNELRSFANSDTPFFLAVGFSLPHLPWIYPRSYSSFLEDISDDELVERASDGTNLTFFTDEANSFSDPGSYEITRYKNYASISSADRIRHYYRGVSFMDAQLGRVMDVLQEPALESLAANTLIVFVSDNGFHLGDHGIWGKKTLYDGATHVPMAIVPSANLMAASPKLRNAVGSTVSYPVQGDDIFPTLLELCNVDDQSDQERSGVSLVPTLKSSSTSVRSAAVSQFWAHKKNNGLERTTMGYSLRTMYYRYTKYMAFKRNLQSKSQDETLYSVSDGKGFPEFYDYSTDGSEETVNRYTQSSLTSSIDKIYADFTANTDRAWSVLHGGVPLDAT